MVNFFRTLTLLIVATLVTYVVATVFVSQFNLNTLANLGIEIGLAQRFDSAIADLVGMLSAYLPLIFVALMLGFGFTHFVLGRFITLTLIWYVAAGFVSILVLHFALFMVLDVSPIAPTRSTFGLLSQALAGAIGGLVLFKLNK